MTPEFVGVVRAALAAGWRRSPDDKCPEGPDGRVRIGWDELHLSIWRRRNVQQHWPVRALNLPCTTLAEAVDLLVALDVLPPHLSSAYELGWHEALHGVLVTAGGSGGSVWSR